MNSSPLGIESLIAQTFVRRVEYRPTVDSTNTLARELAATTARDEIVLVIADEQTAGRGRGSNRWWTGNGALAFSLLVDSSLQGVDRRHAGMIALAAALSIVETVELFAPHESVGLHWPNDVYVGERKLAGILVEALADGRHVVGIGCNVNNSVSAAPEALSAIVTTLRDLTNVEHDRTRVLVELLQRFAARLEQLAAAPDQLGRDAHHRCLQIHQRLTISVGQQETTGICSGIADDGALLLDTPTGQQKFYSGVLVKQQPRY